MNYNLEIKKKKKNVYNLIINQEKILILNNFKQIKDIIILIVSFLRKIRI